MHGQDLLILMVLDSFPGSSPSGNFILAVLGLGVSLADWFLMGWVLHHFH